MATMNAPTPLRKMGTRPTQFSAEEWELRQELAAAYRIVDHMGWSMVIFNHITVRVPGPEHHFLINPYGLRYDEVTASNLVKIDLKGNIIGNADWPVNPAGFTIHSAIHQNVPDALCVIHTHTREGLAVACKKDGLRNTNFYSCMLQGYIAYHNFEGLTVRDDEGPRLVESIGKAPIVILRNHGLLAHGRTVAEAFSRMWTLQLACEAQVLADSMQGETIPVTQEATFYSTRDAELFDPEKTCGQATFDALVRLMDQRDPSFRN